MKYEYGVEYEVSGKRPEGLADDVRVKWVSAHTSGWVPEGDDATTVGALCWQGRGCSPVSKFRIVDERYKPKEDESSWHERGELPPVGAECEYYDQIKESWQRANIVAHHANTDEAIWSYHPNGGQLFYGGVSDFRPIPTERERIIEKASTFLNSKGWPYSGIALGDLYDTGMLTDPKGE